MTDDLLDLWPQFLDQLREYLNNDVPRIAFATFKTFLLSLLGVKESKALEGQLKVLVCCRPALICLDDVQMAEKAMQTAVTVANDNFFVTPKTKAKKSGFGVADFPALLSSCEKKAMSHLPKRKKNSDWKTLQEEFIANIRVLFDNLRWYLHVFMKDAVDIKLKDWFKVTFGVGPGVGRHAKTALDKLYVNFLHGLRNAASSSVSDDDDETERKDARSVRPPGCLLTCHAAAGTRCGWCFGRNSRSLKIGRRSGIN